MKNNDRPRVGRFFIKSRFVVSVVTLFVQRFLGFKL